jgi:hypothetical protein
MAASEYVWIQLTKKRKTEINKSRIMNIYLSNITQIAVMGRQKEKESYANFYTRSSATRTSHFIL